ncbi:uncharacterized protein LOC131996166 [Stomoxys calcitrans]|uniref:uncharacterized protein LOC131996164 n=1 Tax=Stomoxys calcitrans TaxID=35570 RepID=UPI0027E24E9D|nr:uncharacterized protein LOC131996164 [Stomoxys calcitrans]XP_059221602.1 uncharacterized protein LOC131996166 [Stomoxys calcitrans]
MENLKEVVAAASNLNAFGGSGRTTNRFAELDATLQHADGRNINGGVAESTDIHTDGATAISSVKGRKILAAVGKTLQKTVTETADSLLEKSTNILSEGRIDDTDITDATGNTSDGFQAVTGKKHRKRKKKKDGVDDDSPYENLKHQLNLSRLEDKIEQLQNQVQALMAENALLRGISNSQPILAKTANDTPMTSTTTSNSQPTLAKTANDTPMTSTTTDRNWADEENTMMTDEIAPPATQQPRECMRFAKLMRDEFAPPATQQPSEPMRTASLEFPDLYNQRIRTAAPTTSKGAIPKYPTRPNVTSEGQSSTRGTNVPTSVGKEKEICLNTC